MNSEELKGYLDARRFAKELGDEIAGRIEVGMTERDVEKLAGEVFRAHEVKQHWHMPVIGVGSGTAKLRSNFALGMGFITGYFRKVKEDDLVLIDIAPVYNDYPADYTTMHITGKNPELEQFISFARDVAYEIAGNITFDKLARDVFNEGSELIRSRQKYKLAFPPFISMGHRLLKIPQKWQKLPEAGLMYLLLGMRGSFIKQNNNKLMDGLWIIEPYLLNNNFGAKFEVLINVDEKTEILD